MTRTQILLEHSQYSILKEISDLKNVSIAALVRQAVDLAYGTSKRKPGKKPSKLLKLAGIAKGPGKAIAREHDRYLYNTRKS